MISTQFTFPYDVVVTAAAGAKAGAVSINDPGTSNPIQVIPATSATSVTIHNMVTYVYGRANGGAALTSATMTQDNWPDPQTAGTLSDSQLVATPPNEWFVRIHFNDGRWFDIPMGKVNNQGTWLNTRAGALVAANAIETIWV